MFRPHPSGKAALTLAALTAVILAGNVSFAMAAENNRLRSVQEAGELRVCIWPDYYSVTYRNPKTRVLSGIDIDISMELAKELEVKVRYVDSSFPMLSDNLLSNKCDIAMHGVGITPGRKAKLAFTQPYLRSDIYAIVRNNNAAIRTWEDLDKPGRIIAVQAGTVMEPVMRNALTQASLLVVRPPMSRENEVESGRADAFMTDFPYGQRIRDMTDWARLIAPPHAFHLTDYAYALAPGDDSLLERVNRFIGAIRSDQRLARLAQKHRLDPILIHDAGETTAVRREP